MYRQRHTRLSLLFYCNIFITYTAFFVSFSHSDPRISESGLFCGNTRPPQQLSSSLIPVFVKEMESLSNLITTRHFATYQISSAPLPIYALAQCHSDLSQTDCLLCYTASRTKIPRCLPFLSARIYLDGCFLRYDNYSFYHEAVSSALDTVKCGDGEGNRDEYDGKRVGYALGNVINVAVENGRFGVANEGGSVYALAQCWESVGKEECRTCLESASAALRRKCVGRKDGRAMYAGCYLRYSNRMFYRQGDETGRSRGLASLGVIITIALAAFAMLMLSSFASYAGYMRYSKRREELNNLEKVSISFNKSSLNFKYETLEKATDYFNESRKLGQGGAGSVYLGTLPNGRTVAVKRLVFNTRQWVDEFFNEVNLISGIQHKNLVKLLGCSIEGPESLLVYEYVPNKSLDQFLFDQNKTRTLAWKQRFDIITGTAEGLAYLHQGAHVRIIHRDIKSSNVLLDDELTPKIADFGLVRCFGADKTHLSTGIAGTIGYMAPEYLVRGKLTEKADVYSFGVLVLEIVSGKKCNAFTEDSGTLLQRVWQLYKSNRIVEAVDPSIRDDFPAEEASNVLQIGLLCTQASAALRPTMVDAVTMLTKAAAEIPEPTQPPFMNSNLIDAGTDNSTSKRSDSTISFMSNLATKVEANSYTSSDSTITPSSYEPYKKEQHK